MTENMAPLAERFDRADSGGELGADEPRNVGRPSNDVYARVGDTVLRAAREGVRGGMRPDDIIREIVTEHNVRLNLGEFRLLLASRRLQERAGQGEHTGETVSTTDATTVTP